MRGRVRGLCCPGARFCGRDPGRGPKMSKSLFKLNNIQIVGEIIISHHTNLKYLTIIIIKSSSINIE